MPKFTPKCPDCGSVLEKEKNAGYSCPNSECKVIKVFFSRSRDVKRVVREGIEVPGGFSKRQRRRSS